MNQANIDLIKAECDNQRLVYLPAVAYVLATVEHETAGTYDPVREAFYLGSKAEAYRKTLRYYPYYGRGFVQLTWRDNYARYAGILGKNLLADPDQVMEPHVSAFILVHGFVNGTFTGAKISNYIHEGRKDYIAARKCINGADAAEHIAQLAEAWEERMSQ